THQQSVLDIPSSAQHAITKWTADSRRLQACARKELNNRKPIIEEVEFLVTQELEESEGGESRELALGKDDAGSAGTGENVAGATNGDSDDDDNDGDKDEDEDEDKDEDDDDACVEMDEQSASLERTDDQ
ncbi:hypothetical protein BGZ58_005123, partial [Dissophora ornata]